jgi:hypothetical protein
VDSSDHGCGTSQHGEQRTPAPDMPWALFRACSRFFIEGVFISH